MGKQEKQEVVEVIKLTKEKPKKRKKYPYRDNKVKLHHVHIRDNSEPMRKYNKPSRFTLIHKYLYDYHMLDEHKRTKQIYWNNELEYIEAITKDGKDIKIVNERRHVPSIEVPNRTLPCLVLYINGEEITFETSQRALIRWMMQNLFDERVPREIV